MASWFQREAESTIPDDGGPSIALYGADGELLADESMAPGDASLPPEYRTLIPAPGPLNDAD